LVYAIQKSIQISFLLKTLYKRLLEHAEEEKWKRRLTSFVQQKEKHLEFFQYIHLLENGNYYGYNSVYMEHPLKEELVYVALENELANVNCQYKLFTYFNGTTNKVLQQTLQQSFDCAKALIELLDDSTIAPIYSFHPQRCNSSDRVQG